MAHPEFLPDDRIDSRALHIAQHVLGIDPNEVFFISNDITLEELSYFGTTPQNIRGHRQIKSTDIPTRDMRLYPGQEIDPRIYVWYPPFTEHEVRSLSVRDRIRNIKKIERAYDIKLKELKNIDTYPNLTISRVATFVDATLLKKFHSSFSQPS